ncbi:MAG: hypothetical protein EOP11_26965, partial [Proteobacteria bacterium]
MKAYLTIITFLFSAAAAHASAFTRSNSSGSVMSAAPTTQAGRVEYSEPSAAEGGGRGPASNSNLSRNAENRRLCEKIEPGQTFMIK